MKSMTQDEFYAEAERRFGINVANWKFICPMCGTVQSVQQLTYALIEWGVKREDVDKYVGFSCIGRFTGQGDEGIKAKNRRKKWDKGCNWTLGGLLKVHKTEVLMPNGHLHPVFEFADADNAIEKEVSR